MEGEEHHAISQAVWEELQKYPRLNDCYKLKDPRFVLKGANLAMHRGYETWARETEKEIAIWLEKNKNADKKLFEWYLEWLYTHGDLAKRFPDGFM